jgi:hypothetical protein
MARLMMYDEGTTTGSRTAMTSNMPSLSSEAGLKPGNGAPARV